MNNKFKMLLLVWIIGIHSSVSVYGVINLTIITGEWMIGLSTFISILVLLIISMQYIKDYENKKTHGETYN